MSESSSTTPADTVLVAATDPVASQGLFFTVAELRAAMAPIGYMTPADQINAAAAAAAQATANAAIPSSTLGQPLGPAQLNASNQIPLANIPSSALGSSHFLGTWNASTNTPLIVSSTPPNVASPVGGYYIVAVAGTQSIDGNSTWHAGDWIIWNGTVWSDISGQVNPVSSVAGLQGAVSTAQLATALVGTVGLSSAGGELNVELGTTATTAAAGNDSRIVGAAQTVSVPANLTNVASITSYTGNAASIRTAGYYAAGDGGGAFYGQSNTGAPAITDGSGRSWYLQDVTGNQVNILQFGAKPDGLTDMQPGWTAADSFAVANGKAVFIPSAPVSGGWVLRTPMVATAAYTHGEAVNLASGEGTVIQWRPSQPAELTTALTNNPANASFMTSDLAINGNDGLPAIGNIVSSGWLPALATASCGFSGNVMTATGTTGRWAVGQTVSGPGMTNYCSVTSFGTGTGGDGTYNLSAAQSVSGSITVTATGYPNLSAFKAGTAAFRAVNSGIYRNCRSANCKYGVVLDTNYGHIFSYNCNWSGFFGVYCRQNGYDLYFEGCGLTGSIWSAMMGGTGVVSGTNGGITFRAVRCHIGYSPVGVDILNDGGPSNLAGVWEFYGCSFEAAGETFARILPNSVGLQMLLDMYPQIDTLKSQYEFPTSIIGTPQEYFFTILGTLDNLKGPSTSNSTGGGGFYFPGSVAGAYIGTIYPNNLGDMDLDMFGGNVVIANRAPTRIDVRNPDNSRDFLRRRDQIIRGDLLTKGNLLVNPEISSNWAVSTGTTVSVLTLASLTGSGGALAGIAVPQQVFRESNNPNVIVITNSSATPNAAVNLVADHWNAARAVCTHCWIYSTGTGSASNVTLQLITNNTAYYNGVGYARGGSAFQELLFQGERLTDFAGASSFSRCNVVGASSGQTIYLIGLMVSLDSPAAPNQLPSAYAPNGLYVGAENNGLTPAQAPQIIAFQSTPPTGSFPNGSVGINTAATTAAAALYFYVNGGWVEGP